MTHSVTTGADTGGSAVVVERTFRAIGTTNAVLVTDPTVADEAMTVARDMVAELDRVASRFRDDSELSGITRAAQQGPVRVRVSPVLADCIRAALRAARLTDGLVDPTVGRAVEASGYDADIDIVRARATGGGARIDEASVDGARTGALPDGASGPAPVPHDDWKAVPGWERVVLEESSMLSVPRWCLLDLGSSAKAHTADLVAARLAELLPGGFLVNLGGDVAVGGRIPPDGWRVGVEDSRGETRQVIVSRGQALATSSTARRSWTVGGERRHHIVDPRTGRTAVAVWSDVTCAGVSALEANAASTAAVVLGEVAPAWLARHGIPARLDRPDGIHVTTPGWPTEGVAA